jgi:HEAT repeat protein
MRAVGRLHGGEGALSDHEDALFRRALVSDPMVALAALEALMEVGGEDSAALAATVIAHDEADVVRTAVTCMGAHAPAEELATILPAVAHADWSVRAEAIEVLRERAYRRGLPTLLRRLEVEDDPFVRPAILRAIERLEG